MDDITGTKSDKTIGGLTKVSHAGTPDQRLECPTGKLVIGHFQFTPPAQFTGNVFGLTEP